MSDDILKGCVPLKRGEYDLVNISLIGHDPNTGRTYKECSAEWQAWMAEVQRRMDAAKWWQFREKFRLRYKVAVLGLRQGMGF